jgi:hypothetical protein
MREADFRLQIVDFRFTEGGAARWINSIENRPSKFDNADGSAAKTGL